MQTSSLVDGFKSELREASPDLVDNADLLRGVLAGCGDCIKVLDLDGRLIFMSEGGKRVMEVDDFSALKGCPWPDFWSGEGNAQAHAAVSAAKRGETARFRNAANTARGTPRYWDVQVSPILGEDGSPSQLLSISRDITDEWMHAEEIKKNNERQMFLTAELQHRVKNTLATVMSIANRTFKEHAAPLEVFSGRIMTLSRAHDALTNSNWDRASIVGIINDALAPHNIEPGRFVLSGPDLDLNPKQALSIALALNELATNALKYGSLSAQDGVVKISWSVGVEQFIFNWSETGGPEVIPPLRQGFGTRVVTNVLADDFGGSVELSYNKAGVVCSLIAPRANLPAKPATLENAPNGLHPVSKTPS